MSYQGNLFRYYGYLFGVGQDGTFQGSLSGPLDAAGNNIFNVGVLTGGDLNFQNMFVDNATVTGCIDGSSPNNILEVCHNLQINEDLDIRGNISNNSSPADGININDDLHVTGNSVFDGSLQMPTNENSSTTNLFNVTTGSGFPTSIPNNIGSLYFNLSDNYLYVWNGTIWDLVGRLQTLIDNATQIVDDLDSTKSLTFQIAGSSPSTNLQINTNQTTSKSLDIPNITSSSDEIVTTGTNQTITANKLHTGGLTVTDNTFFIRDNLGTTKRIRFECSAGSNNVTLTIAGQQTTSQTLNIPNVTSTDYFVTEGVNQSISGNKIFNGLVQVTDDNFTITDNTTPSKVLKFETSPATANTTLTIRDNQTTDQILNVPNITATDTLMTLGLNNQVVTGSKIFQGTVTFSNTIQDLALTANRIVSTDASSILSTLQYASQPTATAIAHRNINNEIYFNSIGLNFAYILSAAGTTVLPAFAPQMQIIYGSNTQTIRLPPTTSYTNVGCMFTIYNASTKSASIQASDSTVVLSTLAAGCSASVICNNTITSTTTSWTVFNDTQYAGRLQTSTGNPVVINTAAPPLVDQVLTATSATSATWQYPGYSIATVTTTNNTPTNFGATSVNSGECVNIEAYVIGKTADAVTCLGYRMFGVARHDGTLTMVESPVVTAKETNNIANADLIVSGNNVVIQVTGIAATTINWKARISYVMI